MRYGSITLPLTATTNRLERYTNTTAAFGTSIFVTLGTMLRYGRKRCKNFLRELGYNVVSITSCEWMKMSESKDWYSPPRQLDDSSPIINMENIIDDIITDKLFGFVKIDYHVHPNDYEKFSEFPPIFKYCEITLADIGKHAGIPQIDH